MSKEIKYQYWSCKIIVPVGAELPKGFDSPPRQAACDAVSESGIEIVSCYSGWGNFLSEDELNEVKI